MSWSISFETAGDVEEAARAAFEEMLELNRQSNPDYDVLPEVKEQLVSAIAAAQNLCFGVGIAGSDRILRFNLSGHANPGHKQTVGWSNDVISVNVSEKDMPHEAAITEEGS